MSAGLVIFRDAAAYAVDDSDAKLLLEGECSVGP